MTRLEPGPLQLHASSESDPTQSLSSEVFMTPSQERKHNGCILVIADELASLKLLLVMLTEDDYAVHARQLDLESQLRFVKDTVPDLVLVDVRRPGTDGYQVCARLKNDPATRAIPLILIGSIDRLIYQAFALVCGAVDYVTDPFDAEEVLWRIETHISLRRLRENLESAACNHRARPGGPNEDLERAFREIHVLTQATSYKHAEEKVRQSSRELQKAQQALQSNERNLVAIINTIPTAAWTTRPDGYCDFLNQVWLDYAGMTAEQAQGWGWAEAIHPDDRTKLVEHWQSCLASGTPVDTEARIRRFDGSYRWFLIRGNPLKDEGGNILKWYGTCVDIEDRKRGEEALRTRELSWRQIVDNIPGLVATQGAMGEVEFLNRQTLEYFGKTTEELKNWALIDAVHPDDLPRVIEARKKSIEAGQIYEVEHRCRRADGVYRWFQVRGLPVRDTENKITAWYLLLTDIDDRKKAEEALQSSERNLGLMISAIPTYIHVLRADGSVLYVNQAVLHFFGITLADAQKEDYRARFFHPEDVERLREERREALQRPVPFENEQRVLGKDGKYRWFLIRYNPLLDEQGRIDRWYAAATDIEDRKHGEDRLRAVMSERTRLSAFRAEIAMALASKDTLRGILHRCAETMVRHFDAAFARIWTLKSGATELELEASAGMYTRLDGRFSRIPVGQLKIGLIARERKALLTNDVQNDPRISDHNWARAEKIQSFAGYPLVVEDRVVGVMGMFSRQALTESTLETLAFVADAIAQGIDRKRAEEALQSSERDLSLMINAIPAMIHTARADGYLDYFNEPWLEYLGTTLDNVTGWKWTALVHPEDVDGIVAKWRACLATGEIFEYETRVRRADGEYRWMLHRKVPLRDKHGNIVRWYGTSLDVDDRKRAEAQVEQAYLRLAEAQRLSKTGSFITDLLVDDHNWSEEAFRIFEFDPSTKVTVQMIRDRIHPEDLPTFDAVIARGMAGTDVDFGFRIVTSRGVVKHLRGMARVMGQSAGHPLFIGALQDVTESKVAEEALNRARSELAHVARVTTLNALTASIAHEVNQPLSGIITNASTCRRMLDADPPNVDGARETARRIIRDGNRASDVITRLRALFSKKECALEPLDLNEATDEVIALSLSDLQRNRVILRSALAEDLPPVIGDRVQLQQVILNLLRNASDAMTFVDDRPRELLIRTERDEGDQVRLTVKDVGVGFTSENADKLFEAFYTTKKDGMGIGLSISRSIIEAHHGRLWATPNDGPGVTFSFCIPCGSGPSVDAETSVNRTDSAPDPTGYKHNTGNNG